MAHGFAQSVFIRSVPKRKYFNASTFPISCPNGHRVDVVLLGSRVYYLAWRINVICGTFFSQTEQKSNRLELTGVNYEQWPEQEHVDQLQTALRVYLDDQFLSNEGFEDLKSFAAKYNDVAGINQTYIGDFALLFLILHELQHVIRMDQMPEQSFGARIKVNIEGLSKIREERWTAELSHDANAAIVLLISATEVFHTIHKLELNDAKTQAASLVFPGADLALHTLQFVEERGVGKVSPERAVSMYEFRRHPPSEYRRRCLSHVAFSSITNMPLAAMLQGHTSEEWKLVAENTASQMLLRDRLFSCHQKRTATKEKSHVAT